MCKSSQYKENEYVQSAKIKLINAIRSVVLQGQNSLRFGTNKMDKIIFSASRPP